MIRADTKKDYELLQKYQHQAVEIERLQSKNKKIQTILRTRARQDRKRKAKLRKLRLETTNQRLKLERLNNIIDKLEIDIEIGTGKYTYDTDYNRGLSDAFIYMKDRIKELKGDESNE